MKPVNTLTKFTPQAEEKVQEPGETKEGTYVTGCGPSASAYTSWDLGKLHSSTKRDSSLPHSTSGAVPLIPTHIQELISLNQPVYGQAGDYE